MTVKDGDAFAPLQGVCDHTFSRIVQNPNWDVQKDLDTYQEENGGELDVTCYAGVGPDGSSGHSIYKKRTEKSLLDGACIVSSMVPIQMVCKVQGRTKILHQNVLCHASDSARPLRIHFVPESFCKVFRND